MKSSQYSNYQIGSLIYGKLNPEFFLPCNQNSETVNQFYSITKNQSHGKFFHQILFHMHCHLILFVSLALGNNVLNYRIIDRYHIILAGVPFLLTLSTSSTSLSFSLQCDSLHLGHLSYFSYYFMSNMQSLRHACILIQSKPIGHNIFLAS